MSQLAQAVSLGNPDWVCIEQRRGKATAGLNDGVGLVAPDLREAGEELSWLEGRALLE